MAMGIQAAVTAAVIIARGLFKRIGRRHCHAPAPATPTAPQKNTTIHVRSDTPVAESNGLGLTTRACSYNSAQQLTTDSGTTAARACPKVSVLKTIKGAANRSIRPWVLARKAPGWVLSKRWITCQQYSNPSVSTLNIKL
jgi:hypothetical protein